MKEVSKMYCLDIKDLNERLGYRNVGFNEAKI